MPKSYKGHQFQVWCKKILETLTRKVLVEKTAMRSLKRNVPVSPDKIIKTSTPIFFFSRNARYLQDVSQQLEQPILNFSQSPLHVSVEKFRHESDVYGRFLSQVQM